MGENEPVIHVAASQRTATGTPNPGVVREQAFASDTLWSGVARTQPGMDSGWHHHGAYESVLFVLSGTIRMESGPGGHSVNEAEAGDFLYVPAGTIHRETNLTDREGQVVITRVGHGPSTIDVDGPAR